MLRARTLYILRGEAFSRMLVDCGLVERRAVEKRKEAFA